MIGKWEFDNCFPPTIDATRIRKEMALDGLQRVDALNLILYLIDCREGALSLTTNYLNPVSREEAKKELAELKALHDELSQKEHQLDLDASGAARPVVWNGKPADLAWLHQTLKTSGFVNCPGKDFSALFVDKAFQSMPSKLEDYVKDSNNPKNAQMKEIANAIRKREPGTE